VKSTDRVPQVLKLLCDKRISAVPVYDDEKKDWVGIVEMLDFVTVVTLLSNVKSLVDSFSVSGPVPEADYVDQEAKVIFACEVGEFASRLHCVCVLGQVNTCTCTRAQRAPAHLRTQTHEQTRSLAGTQKSTQRRAGVRVREQ
jgi:CBS-domain-containing membrane protein